ncbi:ATP-binding protein [Patescibacteria group bacterium]|nr:ATP-binding protein [Patescibacteria group bacterium]
MDLLNLNQILYVVFWVGVYALFLVGAIVASVAILMRRKRKKVSDLNKFNLTFLHIKLPSTSETEINAAEQFFASLWGFKRSWWAALWKGQYTISFEIVAKENGIGFYVVVPDELALSVEKKINGAYPEAEIDLIDPNEVWDRGDFTSVAELKLSGVPYYPITVYEDLATDSLSTLTSSMTKLNEKDVIAVQFLIQAAGNSWRRQGTGFVARVNRKSSDPEKGGKVDTSFTEGVEKKISKPGFDVSIRIVAIAENKMRADEHIQNIVTSFEQFTDVKYNKFKKVNPKARNTIDNFIYRRMDAISLSIPIFDIPIYRSVSVLNTAELATIFHFPGENVKTPGILWLKARRAPAPEDVPEEGLYLGINEFRGKQKKVYMKEKDRTRHFYIIGQTGTGKSEFMKTLALQDMENGEGLAFIDPHGSDIDDILEKVPEHRIDDVILFDASDDKRPIGLNMLEAHSEEEKHMTINAFIGLLYKLYDPNRQGIMGPQLERAIRNVMLTAMADPESTMVDVLRILIDENYAKSFLPKLDDPLVKRYWTDEMANTSDYHKGEKMGYFVSKFDRFVTDRTMRHMLGQPHSALNFHKIMAEKKILLVDLSKGKIGEENSNFIGLLLVPRILQAALARATKLGKEDFPNFYLYVDEFQNFATDDFATILSEARKYKLNLIVAHQFVSQLDEKIKEAVFGNVGSMAVFRIGADDAEYMEKQFEPTFTQSDLINLPIGNFYTRLLVGGHPTRPFSMKVDWDAVNEVNSHKSPERAMEIRKRSREKYGVPVEEVEAFINEKAGLNEVKEAPIPPRRSIPF